MCPTHPKWLIDLVIHLRRHDHEQPTLYQLLHGNQFVEAEWSPGVALAFIPTDVLAAAQAVEQYAAEARQEHRDRVAAANGALLLRLNTAPSPGRPD